MLCRFREEMMRVPASFIAMLWMKVRPILEYDPPCVTSALSLLKQIAK